MLAPGGYLVVASDAAALAAKYPGVAIVGNFDGQLSNRNDLIRLDDALGNPADEVHYYDSGRWPSSPTAAVRAWSCATPTPTTRKAEAWAASDESDVAVADDYAIAASPGFSRAATSRPCGTSWFSVCSTRGEVLVDDVSVIENPSGTPIQLIQNGTFNERRRRLAARRQPRRTRPVGVIPEPGNPGQQGAAGRRHRRRPSTCEPCRNDARAATQRSSTAASTKSRCGSKWITGSPQLNTRLYFNRLARTTILDAARQRHARRGELAVASPTPGRRMTTFLTSPVVPQPGQPVTVSVRRGRSATAWRR